MQQEKRNIKQKKIVQSAATLFLNNGINKTLIKDIAIASKVGEATIYRHFKTKENIVLEVAKYLSENVLQMYYDIDLSLSGYEILKQFYSTYLFIFKENKNYYALLDEIDNILASVSPEEKEQYNSGINKYKELFDKAYQIGLNDNSIKKINNAEMFYYSTTHSMISLCKKLASKDIILNDQLIDKEQEINCLIDVILNYIKTGD